jgi:hypothetical protein
VNRLLRFTINFKSTLIVAGSSWRSAMGACWWVDRGLDEGVASGSSSDLRLVMSQKPRDRFALEHPAEI